MQMIKVLPAEHGVEYKKVDMAPFPLNIEVLCITNHMQYTNGKLIFH